MQNVAQESSSSTQKLGKVNVHHDIGKSSTPISSNSSPTKSETETDTKQASFMSDSSESEEDDVSEVESFEINPDLDEETTRIAASKFLLTPDPEEPDGSVDPETQARLEALLEAAGIGKLSTGDGKHLADPEVLRRLTSSVSCALDEAAAALTRMRSENPRPQIETRSLVEACSDGDVGTVRKLLTEGRSVHETTEEGESLLSLACSAGYYELGQVLLAMHANVEDRGIKGDCTPLMEAASAGHVDIVSLLLSHGADVNAQSSSGNTPLMYACAGGHEEAVKILLQGQANVEDHNENGHTPLMEAASAGHVGVAKILLDNGAGINTHSNEFKESALTLACYKGHLDMVRFLLDRGADQEHKTDEMHTALMEASMDGHVEVARLLLDSGAQVNMPTDSFESPLTLAACGGHVDLAMLLIERGANIEEVNDEGYTPLMEAAREGHEEMVALLLSQGANINAQTEETQETALTLACCGGFTDVSDFLIKAGADIELGASTPLMEAAQEGHLELVTYLLEATADVHAQTQTGDTALTYACENGHTDVADLLLQYGADLEHESEGGRTPLMKACRAGHLCTVQFLITKHADVSRQTTNNDHTPLSLACAGGHLGVVELLLSQTADPFHKLKDNSTMLIEAAKGGHTTVVQLLLDYPHSLMMTPPHAQGSGAPAIAPAPAPASLQIQGVALQAGATQPSPVPGLDEVPEAVRVSAQDDGGGVVKSVSGQAGRLVEHLAQQKHNTQKSLLRKSRSSTTLPENNLTSAEGQQNRNTPLGDNLNIISKDESNILDKGSTLGGGGAPEPKHQCREEHILQKQQILEELQRVERELQEKCPEQFGSPSAERADVVPDSPTMASFVQLPTAPITAMSSTMVLPVQPMGINIDMTSQGLVCGSGMTSIQLAKYTEGFKEGMKFNKSLLMAKGAAQQQAIGQPPGILPLAEVLPPPPPTIQLPQAPADVVQATAISDRPKAKPVSKKEGKNLRKQQAYQAALQQQLGGQQPGQPMQFHQMSPFGSLLAPQPMEPDMAGKVQPSVGLPQMMSALEPAAGQAAPNALNQMLQQKSQQLLSLQHQMLPPGMDGAEIASQLLEQRVQIFAAADDGSLDADSHGKVAKPYSQMSPLEKMKDKRVVDSRRQKQLMESQAVLEEAISVLAASTSCPASPDSAKVEYFTVGPEGGQIPVLVPPGSAVCVQYQPYGTAGSPVAPTTAPAVGSVTFPSSATAGAVQFPLCATPTLDALPAARELRDRLRLQAAAAAAAVAPAPFPSQLLLHSPQIGVPAQGLQLPEMAPTPAPAPAPCPGHTCSAHQPPVQPPPCANAQTNCIAHQVQVATQTTLDKKAVASGAAAAGGGKGKKARYQQPPRAAGTAPYVPGAGQPVTANNFQADPNAAGSAGQFAVATAGTATYGAGTVATPAAQFSCMDVDSETDSNHDTALTLACAGGHDELVELLLSRGADIEHRDKKGFTPLILGATAGHEKVVEILLNHGADIEAQSERTKDTPLSLACSGGRYEVVELLLTRGSNKEHRNVSDYTPLSLAASGGYVNIIKLLLAHAAEINSRTGSKLGISPLMLAAMNGHTAAVKLLLDMGSDINAQIETNRNTALTLACFQGRHEVVSLLLDRKANVEHRAKTGLTPLMEAASGGYVDVGRVLLDKGADVNAPPVPSSRDTALTIAADKGHCRFVELLLTRGAQVEVKNKKGNSPLWLAANGGHLSVVELLYNAHADIDSQDNRKVSCLMAAFRKGHMKVVKWMVNHVTQFPSDQEMTRYIATVSDKELLDKCQDCVKIIRSAKDQQAAKANKNASILLEELDMEKTREESKKAAAARRRERKKKKKLEKKEEKRKLHEENLKNELCDEDDEDDDNKSDDEEEGDLAEEIEVSEARCIENTPEANSLARNPEVVDKEEGDSGIDANSQGSCSSNDVKSKEKRKEKKKKKSAAVVVRPGSSKEGSPPLAPEPEPVPDRVPPTPVVKPVEPTPVPEPKERLASHAEAGPGASPGKPSGRAHDRKMKGHLVFEASRPHPAEREDFEATGNETYVPASKGKKNSYMNHYCDGELGPSGPIPKSLLNATSPKQGGKREEGWKEVVRKYLNSPFKSKKVSVPLNAISRVIGRGGSNINAIRGATGAHIEVEKQSKGQGERIITIKGSAEATRQAHTLIAALIKDPEVDILQMLPKSAKVSLVSVSAWDKAAPVSKSKAAASKASGLINVQAPSLLGAAPTALLSKPVAGVVGGVPVPLLPPLCPPAVTKLGGGPPPVTRGTAPRLVAAAEKRAAAQLAASTKTTMSYTSAIMTDGRPAKATASAPPSTFAAKLTETTAAFHLPPASVTVVTKSRSSGGQQPPPITSLASTSASSPKHHRPMPPASAPPSIPGQFQLKAPFSLPAQPAAAVTAPAQAQPPAAAPPAQVRSTTPLAPKQEVHQPPPPQRMVTNNTPQEYSLFNDSYSKVQQPMWGRENDHNSMQKGMNFASVAATGAVAVGTPSCNSGKYLDDVPPQVDASKAPGYRGNTMCSPVSSKPSTTPPSHGSYPSAAAYSSEQCVPISSSSVMSMSAKQQQSLAAAAAVAAAARQQDQLMDVSAFAGRLLNNHQQHGIMVSAAQDHAGMYPSQDHGPPLLKMVAEQQANQHAAFHHHHHHQPSQQQQQQQQGHHHQSQMSYSQTQPSGANTTVSMSRLNPRAPDFSLHVSSKPPPPSNMFNAPPFHQRSGVLPPPQQNPNLMGNMNYPLNKAGMGQFHPQNAGGGSNAVANGQRWPMFTHPFHPSHHPDMVGQLNYPNSLAHMNLNHPGNDLLASLENGMVGGGNSPAMSPNNAGQTESHHHKMEDRKIMPIGTERASWKTTMGNVGGLCGDVDPSSWMLGGGEPKMAGSSWAGNMGQTVDSHQLYRSNQNQFGRIPQDDLGHMMDASFQQSGHPDNLNSFHNGSSSSSGISMIHHGLQMMPQFNPNSTDMGPPDSIKMEPTNWDGTSRINLPDVQDKQHGWSAKWNH